jgi:uncharacterized protein YjdB
LTETALLTVTPAELVSISIFPPFASITTGNSQQFTATGIYTDTTTTNPLAADWTSSNTSVATIDPTTGLASSISQGTTTISAAYSRLTATVPMTVTDAVLVSLSISPPSASVAKGLPQLFTATGLFSDNISYDVTSQVTWESSLTSVATISAPGSAVSVGEGDTTISAVASSGSVSATATLTVTPAVPARIDVTPINPIRRPSVSQQFTATKVFTDNSSQDVTSQVNWTSSDSGIATMTTGGLALPVSRGTVTIRADDSGGLTGTTLLLVRDDVTLPDTGQTTCYDLNGVISCVGTGQDGAYTINPPSYSDNGDGTTTDLNTGLVWQQRDDNGSVTWYDAGTYCQNLNLAGTSWRLPTRRELVTILDLGVSSPKINGTYFLNTKAGQYWSSETIGASNVLALDFDTGRLVQPRLGDLWYVRCVVRDTQLSNPSDESYSDNFDGTVIDYTTGLMWQKCSAGQNALDCNGTASKDLWENAITYCEGLMLGGHDDWRLPNVKELESLLYGTASPSIHGRFLFTQSNFYWTSTSCSQSDSYIVNFSDRTSGCNGKTTQNTYVRCVRGGL